MSWLTSVPFAAQLAVVAVLLAADAGLLLGVLVPSGAVLAALSVQVADQPALLGVTIGVAAAASVAGGSFGYWTAHRRRSRAAVGRRTWIPDRVRVRLDRIGHRAARRMSCCPAAAAAVGQCFAGARTLTPRLAATAGIPLSRVLAGTVPAAIGWAAVITTGGSLLATATTWLQPLLAAVGPALLGPPMLLLAAVLVLFLWWRGTLVNHPVEIA